MYYLSIMAISALFAVATATNDDKCQDNFNVADIHFLFDESTSIGYTHGHFFKLTHGEDNYGLMKKFTKEVINSFSTEINSKDGIRFSFSKFHTTFHPVSFFDEESGQLGPVLERLDTIKYTHNLTMEGYPEPEYIRQPDEEFNTNAYPYTQTAGFFQQTFIGNAYLGVDEKIYDTRADQRVGVPKIIVIITDGSQSKNAIPVSTALETLRNENKDYIIVAVGIGGSAQAQLVYTAGGNANNTMYVSDFNHLVTKIDTLSEIVRNNTLECGAIPPPPSITSTPVPATTTSSVTNFTDPAPVVTGGDDGGSNKAAAIGGGVAAGVVVVAAAVAAAVYFAKPGPPQTKVDPDDLADFNGNGNNPLFEENAHGGVNRMANV